MGVLTTGVNLDAESMAKLEGLARGTRRSRSAVIRLLLRLAEVREHPDIALRDVILVAHRGREGGDGRDR